MKYNYESHMPHNNKQQYGQRKQTRRLSIEICMYNEVIHSNVDLINTLAINIMIEERYFSSGNEAHYKIIMIGDQAVGKTTLFWKYMQGEFLLEARSSVTTIDFKIKEVAIDGQTIKLFIWDTAGQEKYRAIVASYFHGCQGVMLVFDLTSPSSFLSATTKWYQTARAKCPDAVFLLIGNKSDLEIRVDEREVQDWARRNGVRYIRTSVKNDLNVGESYKIVSEAIHRKPQQTKALSFTLRRQDVKEGKNSQKKCC